MNALSNLRSSINAAVMAQSVEEDTDLLKDALSDAVKVVGVATKIASVANFATSIPAMMVSVGSTFSSFQEMGSIQFADKFKSLGNQFDIKDFNVRKIAAFGEKLEGKVLHVKERFDSAINKAEEMTSNFSPDNDGNHVLSMPAENNLVPVDRSQLSNTFNNIVSMVPQSVGSDPGVQMALQHALQEASALVSAINARSDTRIRIDCEL